MPKSVSIPQPSSSELQIATGGAFQVYSTYQFQDVHSTVAAAIFAMQAVTSTRTVRMSLACQTVIVEVGILAEGAMTLPVTLSGGVLFAS